MVEARYNAPEQNLYDNAPFTVPRVLAKEKAVKMKFAIQKPDTSMKMRMASQRG